MNAALPATAVITAIGALTADTSLLTLCTGAHLPVATAFLPGQFLQLSVPGVGEIPISYCGLSSGDGSIELCVRHVGHVTSAIKAAVPGDVVGVRGPYGRGFPLPLWHGQDILLISGGLGMAPLRLLLSALMVGRSLFGRVTLLYGAREAGELLFLDELLELRQRGEIQLQLSVDRPGNGFEGLPECRVARVPELLDRLHLSSQHTFAALCGPPVMYRPVVSRLQQMGFGDDRIYLSLERRMKCGVGLCGHCAVGSRLCCIDGPVFTCSELAGIEGALG